MYDRDATGRRKAEHLEICRTEDVEFQRKRTWLEHVELLHRAMPAFSKNALDTTVKFLGRTLATPFVIGAMTGGTTEARKINRQLARVAAEKAVGLALGSQRAMLEDSSLISTYQVRDVAPDILLLGNIGLAQAAALKPEDVVGLIARVGADGICLHLNSAMEMFQRGGDEPQGSAEVVIGRLAKALGERLIVKETGCGISRETAQRLAQLGVRTVDVAGAGGTSWVRVENFRSRRKTHNLEEFEEWGIPTAASLLEVKGIRIRKIASGGLRTGLDLAKCLVLGATMGSAALPVLRALDRGGVEGVKRWLDDIAAGLRAAMILTGCADLRALRRAPFVLTGPLFEWATQRGLWRKSLDRRS